MSIDTPPLEDQPPSGDHDLHGQFDARMWAERFVKRVGDNPAIATSEGAMLAWFSGAIMSGYDHAKREIPAEAPDSKFYTSSECFVAGRLSTMEPFSRQHPAFCLPYARAALEALGEWEPDL